MARAWVLGDDIDTDVLAPGPAMKLPVAEMATHCLAAVRPAFAREVCMGDYVVAGRNFGLGSAREQAALSLKLLGVAAVLAKGFSRIFYRNAINLGLPALVLPAGAAIEDGDDIEVDPAGGRLTNRTRGGEWRLDPLPEHLMAMVADGGLVPHLKRRLVR